MRELIKKALLVLALIYPSAAAAEVEFTPIDAIGQDILNAIKLAPLETIISISDNDTLETSAAIVKADQLVMGCNSSIVFTDVSHPYLIVAAKRLRFKDATENCSHGFQRAVDIVAPSGSRGRNGANGTPSFVHHQGGQGRHGGHGQQGGTGGTGGTINHPPVYIVIARMEAQTGNALDADIYMLFRGIKGGTGGPGGNGGQGGSGEKGGDAADGAFDCRRGPGRGGNAGNGGRYGAGGNGGTGGSGPELYLVGPRRVIDALAFGEFSVAGGRPGDGGQCGASGNPGMTGDQGRLSRRCRSGPGPGARGNKPAIPANCVGTPGAKGVDGTIFGAAINVNDLF